MNAEVYARMLFAALEYVSWQPANGAEAEDGKLSTPELIGLLVGVHNELDWAWNGPTDMLDEEVLADLRTLGWEPEKRDKPA
ncbi:hypothetical protein JMJ56_32970 [Belnapia sp. T18]|uniref:Uncharacterized protein n=2 Tax=Belnapia arida TaxID=2804533 RepID=A0ABS1UDL1_9PROT|nr:hypothetical protein [Belnapia arida]